MYYGYSSAYSLFHGAVVPTPDALAAIMSSRSWCRSWWEVPPSAIAARALAESSATLLLAASAAPPCSMNLATARAIASPGISSCSSCYAARRPQATGARLLKDQIGDLRGVNGSLKFDLKNRRENSRLHPTHLGRRVSVPHSSERLSALVILLIHNRKLDREKFEQNLTSSITQTKIRAKRSESQNISKTRTKGLEHR